MTEKESRKIYCFETSHDFHGKLDFLNFDNCKMYTMNTVSFLFKEKTQSQLKLRKRVMPYKKSHELQNHVVHCIKTLSKYILGP
jgi:hypothetical protein